ncbi:MAG: ABC transporter permease [Desulfarculaceae bacterium]|nr:ABC transporter permease [Desulfarculaceae bacterium]
MILLVNLKEAVRSLLASKQRTLLALLGVIIGIGSVMAMLAIGETIKAESMRQYQAMGTDILTIRPEAQPRPGEPWGAMAVITPEDMTRLARYSRAIRRYSLIVETSATLRAGRAKLENATLNGVQAAYRQIKRLKMARGRFISPLDQGRHHLVLGSQVARDLDRAGAPRPLRELTIKGRIYKVIGVLAPADLGYDSDTVNRAAFAPVGMALRMDGQTGAGSAVVQVKRGTDHAAAGAELNRLMQGFTHGRVSLEVESPKQLLQQMAAQMRLLTLLLAAVGSISLVVGGVGIMNMMLVSVAERRREIGIRRAMGAQKGYITFQFLVESVILSGAGGIIGIAAGLGGAWLAADMQKWQFQMPLDAVGLCLGVALGVGLFFGYYPARKAAGMQIIDALKTE